MKSPVLAVPRKSCPSYSTDRVANDLQLRIYLISPESLTNRRDCHSFWQSWASQVSEHELTRTTTVLTEGFRH